MTRLVPTVLLAMAPLFVPTTGTEIPTILQRVQIGNAPLIPNTGMTPPIALVHPQPLYTAEAVRAGIEDTVTVRAEFDIDGNFRVLEVINSPGFGLEEAALTALENWIFRPAYSSGRRVAVIANVEVEFRNRIDRELLTLRAKAYSELIERYEASLRSATPPAGSPRD